MFEQLQRLSLNVLESEDFVFGFDHVQVSNHQRYFWELLNTSEQARAARYKVTSAALEFICTRGLVRIILGHFLNCLPQEVDLSPDPLGKLHVKGRVLFFNITHSHGKSVIAVSKHSNLGVDLEKPRHRTNEVAIAQRFFSQKEVSWLEQQQNINAAFYLIWSGKEAVSKAVGLGLSLPMASYVLIPSQSSFTVKLSPSQYINTSIQLEGLYLDLFIDYFLCLVRENGERHIQQLILQ